MQIDIVIKTRKSVPSDSTIVAEILRRSFAELCCDDYENSRDILEAWLVDKTPKSVDTWISSPDAYCVTALTGSDKIIGFGMLSRAGELLLLYVSPDHVGAGAGHGLLRAIENQAAAWGLVKVTLDSTAAAKSFYEYYGYRSGESCKSRPDGLSCHAMYKSLDT